MARHKGAKNDDCGPHRLHQIVRSEKLIDSARIDFDTHSLIDYKLGPKTAERLHAVEVLTVGDLLRADAEETAALHCWALLVVSKRCSP